MRKSCISVLVAGGTMLAGGAFGQEPAPTPAQTPAPAAAPAAPKSAFSQGGMDFSFLFDGYVDTNFNHPDSGYNQLRNFDYRADTLHVNMGKITIDRAPAPVGFHLDVGFGQTFTNIHSTDRAPEGLKYFEQAYVSFKPKSFHGLQIDAGEFVTSAGAEVIETNANWNYSRSLLFALAIPYYHFGVRTTFPVGKAFTGGFQVVQGWNNVYDNNSGKTFGFTGAYAWKKVTWSNVYYVGPEKSHTNKGIRHLYDTTVLVNQTDKLSYYVNFDYGHEAYPGASAAKWGGVAGAMRYQAGKKTAFATRLEFFKDADGWATGAVQNVKEWTLTGEYKMSSWLMARAEFRNDWSDQDYFSKEGAKVGKNQPTALLGIVAFLGPKK
jgi:hypothetical protein